MVEIVRIALRRPYTFVVLALLILIVGPLAVMRTPTDIFPDISIPVISVVFQYTGLPPDPMSGRIVTPFQRALTTTVNDIEHIEANAYTGIGVIKIFFQPTADINTANAQVTAVAQTLLKQMPAGITPPLILNYSASTVAILQLALSGRGMSEQALADLGLNFIRTRLVTVPGAAIPGPAGGKQRQVQIDLDPVAAQARGLSGQDVANALAAQNLITPVGTQKIGAFEYAIQLNNSPVAFEDLGRLPIKTVKGATVYLRDVAHVHDGNPPQTNIVHVDGGRSVMLTVLKNGSASTLAIIASVKDMLEELRSSLPDNLEIKPIGDQSLFVSRAVDAVVIEGVVAAALTSLMILLFLGSWRSTVIIAMSIPLSVLGSLTLLALVGETLNIMTLGGLALAVGILVDDATVTIENINWHLERGKSVETAILDGAAQIVTPAFVSLLCICIVFVPMFFLSGVARFLFVPMAEAVMFAMVCSFVLSRTLVPTMANYLLQPQAAKDEHVGAAVRSGGLARFQLGFATRFERIRSGYRDLLTWAMGRRHALLWSFFGFVVASFALVPFLGRNFFPSVDGGQILIHARAQPGTRVEETARIFAAVQNVVREVVSPRDLGAIVDNIGLPTSGINMTYNNTGTIGSQDGDIQIALNAGHQPTGEYVRRLREELPRRFPGVTFSFTPADIVSQILNFGVPAPIDLQVRGANLAANFGYAQLLLNDIRRIPGVADARIQQARGMPSFNVDVDRTRAQYAGLTERDVTNSMVVNLAGSGQVAPTFWLNPQNGVQYPIVLQTPQYRLDDLTSLQALPITAVGGASTHLLGALAQIHRGTTSAVVSQHDIQPMIQIYATTQDRDLGAVAATIRSVIDAHAQQLPKGSSVHLLGQVQTMDSAFSGLLFGLLGAIVLIYLLIVVNFQSWSDPFVIVSALPAAVAGIVWMLFATFTTLSVPALTGAIMCMGIATANSVLVVSFAREKLAELGEPIAAAVEAGFVRFRPVLMTAFAMIIGMTPMALGLGEGGEQNAPLGRAVIGGLLFATAATLLFVPVMFSIVHGRSARAPVDSSESIVEKVMRFDSDPDNRARSRRIRNVGLMACAALLLIVVAGIATRVASDTRVRGWTGEQAIPTVAVVKPSSGGDAAILDLPARLEAMSSAPLYARVSGYLKEWNVDIGAEVKAGELLARIEAPDLEDQLAQARADLATAEANAALASTTWKRWQSMLSLRAVSKQEADEKAGDLAAKQAIVHAQRANVSRLKTLHDFTSIVAPFDGVVTARNTDVGALIDAGGAAGQELFVVADIRRLRVYVDVPQVFSAGLTQGIPASIAVPEHPGKRYAGRIEAASGAVNAATGTTLIQLAVDNADAELMPGGFATVNFAVPHDFALLRIPSSALIFDKSGLTVATLDARNHVVMKPVTIARDHGASIEIASGLSADDRVIETPPDGLVSGTEVRVVDPDAARPVAMR